MKRVIILAAALLAWGTGASHARCSVEPTPGLREHADVEGGRLTVKAGYACGLSILGLPGAITETKIVSKPSRGVAEVRNNIVYYGAKAGVQGEDEFTYAHVGTDTYGAPMTIKIKRKATIVP